MTGRGTPERGNTGTPGRGTRGLGDAGTSGREDVINKQLMNFPLNLQFTIIGGYVHDRHDMFACLFFRESPWYRIVSA